jgi:hypothetical protein
VIYKLLGVLALFLGLVFALLTLAVLIPFLGNFNLSLLALIVIFGIFAIVFLSVGWQLLHPPRVLAGPEDEEEAAAGEDAARTAGLRPGDEETGAVPSPGAEAAPPAVPSGSAAPSAPGAPSGDARAVPAPSGLVFDEEEYVTVVAATDSSDQPATAAPGPAGDDDELDFSWVSPAPRRGATFVGLDEAHTELEEDQGQTFSSDGQEEDPYFLRPHGYFRKPGAPVRPEGTEE